MVSNLSLIEQFDSLESPLDAMDDSLTFNASPISGTGRYRIAKDIDGCPTLLLSLPTDQTGANDTFRLENVAIESDVLCRVSSTDGRRHNDRFTILRCTSSDRSMHSYFLRIVDALIRQLGSCPSRSGLTNALRLLANLFSALSQPSSRSIQGIWAELFVIANGRRPVALLRAWRTNAGERFDFSSESQRIEVKSTSGQARRHHFSLAQLDSHDETDTVIASMFVRSNGRGISLVQLVDQLTDAVSGTQESELTLQNIIAGTLGVNWREAGERLFDPDIARRSLNFYRRGSIPRLGPVTPDGVSEVSFVSDLSLTPDIPTRELRESGGLFADVTPISRSRLRTS